MRCAHVSGCWRQLPKRCWVCDRNPRYPPVRRCDDWTRLPGGCIAEAVPSAHLHGQRPPVAQASQNRSNLVAAAEGSECGVQVMHGVPNFVDGLLLGLKARRSQADGGRQQLLLQCGRQEALGRQEAPGARSCLWLGPGTWLSPAASAGGLHFDVIRYCQGLCPQCCAKAAARGCYIPFSLSLSPGAGLPAHRRPCPPRRRRCWRRTQGSTHPSFAPDPSWKIYCSCWPGRSPRAVRPRARAARPPPPSWRRMG